MKIFDIFRTKKDDVIIEQKNKVSTKSFNTLTDMISFFGSNYTNKKYTYSELESKYRYGGLITSCIDVIANQIAKAEPIVYRQKNQTESDKLNKHHFTNLLEFPNDYMSTFDLLDSTAKNLIIFGDSYWNLPLGSLNLPKEIHLIPAPQMYPIIDGFGLTQYYIRFINNKEIKYEKNEIIHFKEPDPATYSQGIYLNNNVNTNFASINSTQFSGLSMIQKAAKAIETDTQLTEYLIALMKNGAVPSAIIKILNDTNPDEFNKLKELINQQASGQNRGKLLVINENMEWKESGISPKNLLLIEAKQFVRTEILDIFRVPESLLGRGGDTNKSTASVNMSHFQHDIIKPLLQKISGQISLYIKTIYNKNLFLEFTQPLPDDPDQIRKDYETATKLSDSALKNPYSKSLLDSWMTYMHLKILPTIKPNDILFDTNTNDNTDTSTNNTNIKYYEIELTTEQQNLYRNIPEDGMGYSNVNVILQNDDILENCLLLNCTLLQIPNTYSTITTNDIKNIQHINS